MKCEEIYRAVLATLAETDERSDLRDYEERFPFLLAAFINMNAAADERIRQGSADEVRHRIYVGTDGFDDFPLSDIFIAPTIFYIASMLIVDENSELSDKLFERYSHAMTKLLSALPFEHTEIADVYG